MACNCVTDEGAPSLTCYGTCSIYAKMFNPEAQARAMEDSFTNRQLQQFSEVVRCALRQAPILDNMWIDGFLKGFQHGRES